MAEVDPWDEHLEAVTLRLSQMTSGPLRGRVALTHAGGWVAEFRGAGRSITIQLANQNGPDAVPGDYARAVIYGCDYHPIGNEGRPSGFGKTLTLREGYSWDDESIREQVLEALGVMRYLLGVTASDEVTFEDHSRTGPLQAAKSGLQRRRKR